LALIPPFGGPVGAVPRIVLDLHMAGAGLVALALVAVGFAMAARWRQASRQSALQERLLRLQETTTLLDEAIARCIEIEDRYTHPELRGADHQSTFLTLRRELAERIGRARALIEAYGDLREPRLAGEAVAIAERPVFVSTPEDTEVERSLPELRRLCAKMRNDQVETMARLRRQLDRRVWRKVLARRA